MGRIDNEVVAEITLLSIYEGGPPPPVPHPFNLAADVLAKADQQPDKLALAIVSPSSARRWRFGALSAAVQGIAAGLVQQGLGPGDRLLMRLGNDVEFPLTFLGSIWAGIVPVPTSAQLTVPEVTRIAEEIQPNLIVAGDDVTLPEPLPCPVISSATVREMEALEPLSADLGDPNRPAFIIYTSGTSGRPRGVVHAHRTVRARRMMWTDWYGLTTEDRLLHAGAFNWTYTLGTGLMDPWAIGASALIPAAGVRAEQLPLLLKRYDATIFAAAPGVYRQMLRAQPVFDAPRLRHGLSAGEKLPPALRAAWTAASGTAIHEGLGMSECSTFVTGAPDRPAPQGTSGRPQRGRRIAVLDTQGAAVPRGTPGELAVDQGDIGLMLGYLDAPEETAARLIGDWFRTGDTVTMGDDDAITYLGRADDMLNAGGYRVSPLEVEAALLEHPNLQDVACAEVTVKADTTVIAAFYTDAGSGPVSDEALAAFAAARLAKYKCPRVFVHRTELPRSGNGKVNRKALRGWRPGDP